MPGPRLVYNVKRENELSGNFFFKCNYNLIDLHSFTYFGGLKIYLSDNDFVAQDSDSDSFYSTKIYCCCDIAYLPLLPVARSSTVSVSSGLSGKDSSGGERESETAVVAVAGFPPGDGGGSTDLLATP